ncbi:ABC transporter permease [Sinomonas susongensis]|uniref:ABC transporter permease n=1 Tax=Sinomonas susongensis TaxID=1324851 RepID=UPI001108563C|nr:ABC transporter permease [Sinomonas susongensis]
MFARYLRRELSGRRKQTVIIAIALALAIALVIVVNALSAGVRDAQKAALASVYGVGTDITVTQAPAAPGSGTQGPRFQFNGGNDSSQGSSTSVNQSRLISGRGSATFDSTSLATVQKTSGVQAASAALSLTNVTLNGQVAQQNGTGAAPTAAPTAPSQTGESQSGTTRRGFGGNFGVDSFSVLGVDGNAGTVGPLASATVSKGRALGAQDVGQHNAVVDSSYATTANLSLGGTINVGGQNFTIVGIVSATGSDSQTASDVYIPLDVAQTLSTETGKVSTVYVQAASSDQVSTLKTDLQKALPSQTINTQADLASNVSGSLSTASGLISGLGTWLSVAVLAAAFLLAALLTLSGVSRRTREFGTLKAIGWRNGRIVRQVAGESIVQSLIGGVVGIAVGLIAVLVINMFAPTLSAGTSGGRTFGGAARQAGSAAGSAAQNGGGGFGGGGGGGFAGFGGSATHVALGAPVTPAVVLIAVGIAILGGLIAGVVGGWRAARLQPAEALRSLA